MVKDHSDSEKGNPLPLTNHPSYIPRPLSHQLWSTGWNEKYLNGSTIRVRVEDLSHHEQTLNHRKIKTVSVLN